VTTVKPASKSTDTASRRARFWMRRDWSMAGARLPKG
jgi:hypothetical protein